jgi:hypothetical protein
MTRGHVLIGALVLLAQLGSGTPGANPAEQIERSVTQPVPQAPPLPATTSHDVWVPDRAVPDTVYGGMSVTPGHWERALPDGRYSAPPLTTCSSGSGQCSTTPAGEYPMRIGP